MTATALKEIIELIGQTAVYDDHGLRFSVQITDAKQSYGQLRVQIVPIAGSGCRWVNVEKVQLNNGSTS